ncbi:MAG TPA: hypothetical protein VGD69_02745 [Herpetosiphonaceae bacterium]
MTSPVRFKDPRTSIYAFLDEILVVCPQCSQCARIVRQDLDNKDMFAPRRCVCKHCGFTKDWAEHVYHGWYGDPPRDGYFAFPLWLNTPCCDHVLWAYNRRHLEFLEGFVSAPLRERDYHPQSGWANSSTVSRLPKWIKTAKNREHLLKAITRLKARLEMC